MTGGFRVESAAMAAHGTEIDALADRAHRAAGVARPLQRDAYGLVGQAFASMADDACRTGSRAVAELAESVRRQAAGVRAAGEGYVAVDRGAAAAFGDLL